MLASKRHAGHAAGEFAEHLGVDQRFGEDRVGAGIHVHLRPRDRAVHALAGGGVGARDDVRGGGGPCRAAATLAAMSCASASFLSLRWPHFFGSSWSSMCTAPAPGILEGADHVHDVQRLAVAGVAVDQHRQAGGARDLADEEADLVDGDDAEIGQAHRGRHRGAREIERLEAGRLGLQRGHAVMRAGHLQDAGPRQQAAEALAGGLGRAVRRRRDRAWRPPFAGDRATLAARAH